MIGACNRNGEASNPIPAAPAENQVTAAGVTMQWSVIESDLSVKLSASTAGWVAVGFKPSVGMKDANIIIGYVSNGNVFIRDDCGSGMMTHEADAIDNVTAKSGTEANGVTEINFKMPLDSGDPQDQVLVVGNTYNVILAQGGADNFTLRHSDRALVSIKIK